MTVLRRRLATATATALVTMVGIGVGSSPPAGAASAADRCYTAALVEVFLDRPASVYDVEAWIDRYEPEAARPALPRALAASDEWLAAVVIGIYDDALDREPDAEGLAFWIDRLRRGSRVATLTASVYGSNEVWQRGGATAKGFVEDVFPRIMGRNPSADDVTYWAGQVGPRGRGGVAKALVGSIENRRARVVGLYQQILGRAPEPDGLAFWADRLARVDDVQLAVQLASSAEAYQRAQQGCSAPPAPTTTTLTHGTATSQSAKISGDGRWIAFVSDSDGLVAGDDDGDRDLFLIDRQAGSTTKITDDRINVGGPAISADGSHVAFTSREVHDGPIDLWDWDRASGTFTRITDGNGLTSFPNYSADGRYITFNSHSSDLVPGDLNGAQDVFVWDRTTGTTERITDAPFGGGGADITGDGSMVTFNSSSVLAPGGTDRQSNVYRWQRSTGDITYVAPGLAGPVADDGDVVAVLAGGILSLVDSTTGEATPIEMPSGFKGADDISADGSTVVLTAWVDGTYPGDTHNTPDVFVWERATGTVARVSPRGFSSGIGTTSADGRHVVFQSAPRTGSDPWGEITLWDRGS